jgi:hypothetical protein
MSGELARTLGDMEVLETQLEKLARRGIDTTAMENLVSEARGWAMRARSISHGADAGSFRELTGMAKVRIMSTRELIDRSRLELGIRRAIFLVMALLAGAVLLLLALRLKLIEREQKRSLLMDRADGPEGGPAE